MAISGERPIPYPGVPPKKGKDHGPSQKDIDAANAGQLAPKGAERFIQRLARSWAIRLGLVASASYGAYQVPAIQRAVDSVYHDTLQKLGLEAVVVPTTFNPSALKGVLGEENTVQINAAEYSEVAPPIIEGDQFNMPLAIKFKDGIIRPLRYEMDRDKINPENNAVNIITIDGLTAGDILLSPFDGEISFTHPRVDENRDGSLKSAAFFIYADGPKGSQISLTYSTVSIKPLIESPITQDGIPPRMKIKKGDPIGIIQSSDKHQFFNGQVQISGHAFLDKQVKNLTIASTPEGKAIVLQ